MQRRRLQISIRTALAVLALVAIALGLWVNFRQTVVFSYSRMSAVPHFNVPEDFDLKKLDTILNSPDFSIELADENPEHRQLIAERWDELDMGVEFQYVEAGSFQMHILYPRYEIQHRSLEWTGIEISTSPTGNTKLQKEVTEKNESLRAALLRKIFSQVDELADGKTTVSSNFAEYLPKRRVDYLNSN